MKPYYQDDAVTIYLGVLHCEQDFNWRGSASTCESEPEMFFAAIFANRQADYKDA